MSSNSLRVLAGAAAAVFALLTAIAVGLVSRQAGCVPGGGPQSPTSPSAATSPPATPSSSAPGGRVDIRPQQTAQTTHTPATTPAAAVATVPDCASEQFAARPALTALGGAGLTGLVTLGLLLLAARRRPARAPAGASRPTPPAGPGSPAGGPAPAGPVRPGGPPPRGPTGDGPLGTRAISTAPRPAGVAPPGVEAADRAALVRACIYVRDRVTSRALADRLGAALSDAGVSPVEPVGDRFDPSRHEAGGATPATDPAQAGTIAAVEVPGYTDRGGRVLRAPVVTVFQAAPKAQPATQDQTAQLRAQPATQPLAEPKTVPHSPQHARRTEEER